MTTAVVDRVSGQHVLAGRLRFTGFDDKIVAMYARGMTVREIQGFLAEQYASEVSPEFISSVTDAVMAEVAAWQARPLEPMYPVPFFGALRVKIREEAVVRNKATVRLLKTGTEVQPKDMAAFGDRSSERPRGTATSTTASASSRPAWANGVTSRAGRRSESQIRAGCVVARQPTIWGSAIQNS